MKAGTQLKPKSKTSSLNSFKSSYLGSIHKIWSRLSQSLVREGLSTNWSRIKSSAKKIFTGKWSPADERAHPQRKKTKKNENYNTKLNNKLNAHTDWDGEWFLVHVGHQRKIGARCTWDSRGRLERGTRGETTIRASSVYKIACCTRATTRWPVYRCWCQRWT